MNTAQDDILDKFPNLREEKEPRMAITKEVLQANLRVAEQNVESARLAAGEHVGRALGARDLIREQIAQLEAEEAAAAKAKTEEIAERVAPEVSPSLRKPGRPKGSPNKKPAIELAPDTAPEADEKTQ